MKALTMNHLTGRFLPLGVGSFEGLLQGGFAYVDKTEMVCRLASTRRGRFFLARPRRFGKSLLVSTFESLFRHGLRDFRGLAIEKLWSDKTYDVVRLDFSEARRFASAEQFQKRLTGLLTREFGSLGFAYQENSSRSVCEQLSEWLRSRPADSLVILIDEYEAPLTACLDRPELFNQAGVLMSEFYAALKNSGDSLRFLFVTGIVRFSKTGIFADAVNSIVDITLKPQYGTLLGFTQEEIGKCLADCIDQAAQALGVTASQTLDLIGSRYGGYCFDELSSTRVSSPWAVLYFLKNPRSTVWKYWIRSGGSISDLFKKHVRSPSLTDPEQYGSWLSVDRHALSLPPDAQALDDVVLLMQAGYLTIKEIRNNTIFLGYPNCEVAEAMARYYTQLLLKGKNPAAGGIKDLREHLASCDVQAFAGDLSRAFLAIDSCGHPVTDKAGCRALVSVFLNCAGIPARSESHNTLGRTGIEFAFGGVNWLLEVNFAKTGENAKALLAKVMNEMRDRRAGEQDKKGRLMRLGLVFSEDERRFVECDAESIETDVEGRVCKTH